MRFQNVYLGPAFSYYLEPRSVCRCLACSYASYRFAPCADRSSSSTRLFGSLEIRPWTKISTGPFMATPKLLALFTIIIATPL